MRMMNSQEGSRPYEQMIVDSDCEHLSEQANVKRKTRIQKCPCVRVVCGLL